MNLPEVEFESPSQIPTVVKVIAGSILVGLVVFTVVVLRSFEPPNPREAKMAALELEKQPSGEDDHDDLRFANDEPPMIMPVMQPIREQDDLSGRTVIGVAVGDVSHAFVIRDSGQRSVLIISTRIGDNPVAIAHNYAVEGGVTRVFTSPDDSQLIDLRLGGFDDMKTLVLLYQGVRYNQLSQKIPLQDLPFEVTTLANWHETHPETLVNFDEERSELTYYWPEYKQKQASRSDQQ